MRMWMVNPKLLCNKHLVGEHGEIHKFRHTFVKQYKISGRISPVVQIEPFSMESRHNELAEEMTRRGLNHKSSYRQPDLSYLQPHERYATVSGTKSIEDLKSRCEDCNQRIKVFLG